MSEDLAAIPRPNPARSVRLVGPLTQKAADRLAKEITQLRRQSLEPVTVYIRSTGGEVEAFHQLERIFHPRDKTKKHGQIITVAEKAGSASAYLLVLGHYAYAVKNTRISLHGVRCADTGQLKSLRRETALALALHLDRENRAIAQVLAKRMALRLGARYGQWKASPSPSTKFRRDTPAIVFEKFIQHLARQQTSARTRRLLFATGERLQVILAHAHFFPRPGQLIDQSTLTAQEARLYQALIAYEVKAAATKDCRLRPAIAANLLMDFLLAKDFLPGHHLQFVRRLVRTYGRSFLTPTEVARYNRGLSGDKIAAENYLFKIALPHALGLWYFCVTLSLGLLADEYNLSAAESRGLGLVDELI